MNLRKIIDQVRRAHHPKRLIYINVGGIIAITIYPLYADRPIRRSIVQEIHRQIDSSIDRWNFLVSEKPR